MQVRWSPFGHLGSGDSPQDCLQEAEREPRRGVEQLGGSLGAWAPAVKRPHPLSTVAHQLGPLLTNEAPALGPTGRSCSCGSSWNGRR